MDVVGEFTGVLKSKVLCRRMRVSQTKGRVAGGFGKSTLEARALTKVTTMATALPSRPTPRNWMDAKSLLHCAKVSQDGPQCALVPDSAENTDHIAVVYDKGDTPPKITIHEVSGSVHTVCANGVAVAVVASANGPAPRVDDVLLVERAL